MSSNQTQKTDFRDKVFWLVWNIPEGKCISYGDIAALAGSPRAARIVGGIAHNGPSELPWHRVIHKDGRLASGFPGGPELQKQLLQAEDVAIKIEKVSSDDQYWWRPSGAITRPIVVIIGETASGKSSIAMDLAENNSGAIICADAWTVKKGLDIGTAKPGKTDMARIDHYLVDVVEPDEAFSAAKFQELASQAIIDSYKNNKLPIIVGGNGLYIDGLVYGYSFLPDYDEALRKKLQSMNTEQVLKQAMTAGLDTSSIDIKNKRRLIRLIETDGKTPKSAPVRRPNTLLIGVKRTKQEITQRIAQRINQMIDEGLANEVESLADKYGWEAETMKAICYREFKGYFEGEVTLDEVKNLMVKSNNGLAKRQRTWNKKYKNISWVTNSNEAQKLVSEFLAI